MAEAADVVVEGAQLVEDIVGRAGEDQAGVDRVFDGHRARVDVAAVPRLDAAGAEPGAARLEGLRALGRRRVAGRVHELWRDNSRGAAVAQDLVGAPPAFFARVADADQRHIGEPLLRDWAGGLGRLFAIGLEDWRRADPAGVEHADGYSALGRLHRATGAADRHPNRRMRLLPRPRPDI